MTDFLCECIPMMIFMSQAQCGEHVLQVNSKAYKMADGLTQLS